MKMLMLRSERKMCELKLRKPTKLRIFNINIKIDLYFCETSNKIVGITNSFQVLIN